MKFKKLVLALCLAAFGTFAAAQILVDNINSPRPQFFHRGFLVGKSGSFSAADDTENLVTRSIGKKLDYDFPAIVGNGCVQSSDKSFTVTGVQLGDPCFIGVAEATPSDGGSANIIGSNVRAVARAANLVELIACNAQGDAGTLNLPDAGYNVRCISNL